MSVLSLFESSALAGALVTLALQSLLMSLLGTIVLLLLRRKSAPVRSLICSGSIAALFLVFAVSAGFRLSGIAWRKPSYSTILAKASQAISRPSPNPADKALPSGSMPSSTEVISEESGMTPSPASRQTTIKTIKFINSIGIAWALGILFFLFRLGYGLIFLKAFRSGLVRAQDAKFDNLIKWVAASFKQRSAPEIFISSLVESPITVGLYNPIVIIPEQLYASLTDIEMKGILIHELAHIYHHDHIIGAMKRIFLAVHWWNPLAFLLNSEHDLAREEVCDNYVLNELNPREYSECLASLAERVCLMSELPAAAGMAGSRFMLKTRVESILSQKRIQIVRTRLSFKVMIFAITASATLAIAGFQGQVHIPNVTIVPRISVSAAATPIMPTAVVPNPSPSPSVVQNPINSTSTSMGPKEAQAEATRLVNEGLKLTDEQAAELEQQLMQDPQDIRARSLIISYYSKKELSDKTFRTKRYESILWLVQNNPEVPILCNPAGQMIPFLLPNDQFYLKAEALWQKYLQEKPDNLMILWNAASFYRLQKVDTTIECLAKLRDLDPKDAEFLDNQLGQSYRLKMIRTPNDPTLAQAALNSFERAQAESTSGADSHIIIDLGKAALAAGEFDKAADYANKMLAAAAALPPKHWDVGNQIYFGHYVLGMLAVQKGDLDEAEKQLLAAADTSGSPQLNSFGPNMSLAKALLELGHTKTVLEFLQKCSKFWRKPDGTIYERCSMWIQQLEQGQTPDFRPNLAY